MSLRVLVTRPSPQGESLCEALRAAGHESLFLPTLTIGPPYDLALLQQQIKTLSAYTWLIFISPNAVNFSMPYIQNTLPPHLKIAAVGGGTAAALAKFNLAALYPEKEWSSEGLLKLPALQKLDHEKIAIVRGEGGREVLANELAKRGAQVSHWVAYARYLVKPDDMSVYINILHAKKLDIIVSTSGESLQNLLKLFAPIDQALLIQVPVLVTSERLVALAKELKFSRVFLAKNPNHESILEELSHVRQ